MFQIIRDETLNALTKEAINGNLAGVDSFTTTMEWVWDRRQELSETLTYKGLVELIASKMWTQAAKCSYVGSSETERILWVYSILERLKLI